MTKAKSKSEPDLLLRQKAEELLKNKVSVEDTSLSNVEMLKLIHELDVHQIELEMQNEELKITKNQAEIAAEKYINLYDFAPSGYFTLSREGEIMELNFRGANFLGKDRLALINSRFGFFVSNETRPLFNLFLEKIFDDKIKESCEITLSIIPNIPTHVYLTGIAIEGEEKCIVTMLDITKRKIAELNVLHSDLLLKTTIDSQKDSIIFSLDDNYNYLVFNKAHHNLMKQIYNVNVKVGMNILECISTEEDRINAKENYERALKGESHTNIKVFGDLEKAFYEGFYDPIIDVNNKIIGASVVTRNISERVQSEELLKKSEEKYRKLFDENKDSITIFRIESDDTPSNFIEANIATTDIFGYTRKELLSISISDLESLSKKKRKDRMKALRTQGKIDFETIIKNKKGNLRNVEIESIIIIYDNEPAVMNITRDITERKQMENNIKKAHENLATILEAIPDLLFEIGVDGRIYHYHSHHNDLLAIAPEEFIGKFIQEVMPADVTKVYLCAIHEANEKGRSTGHQYSLQLLQGEFWFELSVSPIAGYSNDEKHFIALARDITERKLAGELLLKSEEKYRRSEEKLRSILDSTDGIVWEADAQTFNFTYVSKQAERLLGFPIEDWYENGFWENHIHPEDRDNAVNYCEFNTKQMLSHDFTYRFITKDGDIVWLRDISNVVAEDGKPRWLRGVMLDVTSQKGMDESLRESEEKYRSLVENSPDGIVIYIDEKITYVNEEGLRMMGAINREDLVGKSVLQFVHPDSQSIVVQGIKEVTLDNYLPKTIEGKLIRIDSTTIDVEIKAIPTIFDHKSAVEVIVHDITERKHTEEKIRQLSRAVEQSPVTVVITNTMGEIEYVNPKFTAVTGYALDEIIGKNSRFLKSGHTSPDEYKELWKTIIVGKDFHGEFHNKKKNGEFFWESATISPILNSQGKTTHFIAIKEDITSRKLAENELVKAKEHAEESDRLKSAFLANMSHEIRTPMNGILGFTELLKEPKLSGAEQQEYIKIIEKSGVRMLNIINDIISISKVESGQMEVLLSETNVNDQIDYIYTFFKPQAKQKELKLSVHNQLDLKDFVMNTDREKVYAILTNLVKNAIKFTNSGSIEFGCTKKGKYLEFFVKDTGSGIPKLQQKIIFERFRQVNETISRSHEGSGLGLAISKAYVEMLGGKIWVESEKGKGSVFYFTLPINAANELKEKTVVENLVSEEKSENKIKDLKILIVEDDSISKLLISIAVKPFSKEILKVSTGGHCLEICRNNHDIDLIMMDINMPIMDGYEATKEIRKFDKDVIIIAQTANGMPHDRDEAIAAGCNDYISKPINIASLNVLMQKYFKDKHQ